MRYQAHWFYKRLGDKQTVKGIVVECWQFFNCHCMLGFNRKHAIARCTKVLCSILAGYWHIPTTKCVLNGNFP